MRGTQLGFRLFAGVAQLGFGLFAKLPQLGLPGRLHASLKPDWFSHAELTRRGRAKTELRVCQTLSDRSLDFTYCLLDLVEEVHH